LQHRIERLRTLQSTTLAEYAADSDRRDLIEHNLRVAIESCSDIALLLAARLGLPEPTHRRDVFGELANTHRLPTDLANTLAELTSLRNLLVHRYLTVEPVRMLQHLQSDLRPLEQFAAIAIGWADELEGRATNSL
jgi:uncharacterized protein YutE (UPF0331/DUF86 family)